MTSNDELHDLLASARAAPARRRRLLILAGAVLAVAVSAILLARGGEAPVRFETAEVRRGDLQVTITATGEVRGVNTVEVGAEVTGRVVEVFVDFDAAVQRDQLLARIDPEPYVAAVEEAEARVRLAEASLVDANATLREAEAALRRARAQGAEGLISRQDLDAAEAAAARARAQLEKARAQLRLEQAGLASARTKLARTEIRSPIDGIVLSRLVEPGQTVTAGFETPVLFKVTADLSSVRVHAEVDESDVGRVRPGQRATFTVDAWPDRVFEAEVEAVRNEPIADETVVAYETLLRVENAGGLLRPGMTATATIVVASRTDALLVPNAALRFAPPGQGGFAPRMPGIRIGPPRQAGPAAPAGPAVWIEGPGGAAERRPVKVLATDGRWSEVEAEGLEPGTKVIVDLAEPA